MKEAFRNGSSICDGFHEGDFEGGSSTGDPEDMLRKARKWASASIGAPLLGNMEGRFFLRAFLSDNFIGLSRGMQYAL
jgi:hypothetical protein